MCTAEICTVLLASVLGRENVAVWQDQKHVHPEPSASRSECSSSRDHTRSPNVFRASHTMNATRVFFGEYQLLAMRSLEHQNQ